MRIALVAAIFAVLMVIAGCATNPLDDGRPHFPDRADYESSGDDAAANRAIRQRDADEAKAEHEREVLRAEAYEKSQRDAARLKYIEAHPELSAEIIKAIEKGQVIVGMTQDAVRAVWGNPCTADICLGTRHTSWGDSWQYGRTLVYFNAAGIVTGWSQ